MKVGLIGLGKLGLPVALAVEGKGHEVYGCDASPAVIDDIRRRRLQSPERDAEELLMHSSLRLVSPEAVVQAAEIVFVAVQTPHEPDLGGADTAAGPPAGL